MGIARCDPAPWCYPTYMKHIVGALGVLLVASFLGGCSSQQTKAQAPADVLGRMKTELSHSLAQVDTFDAMDDELAHAIGTTTLTGETVLGPMPLPEERMSVAAAMTPAVQTWGISEPEAEPLITAEIPSVHDIPDTRD